ncbi:MAG: GDSL family lipase [Mycolicibacterium cosmeticum]|nr:GDSL family lipase [Mycolicibacterium cosmeticum]
MTDPRPFLRGCAWPAVGDVPYPRADPVQARRLPADTWLAAQLPAGVRLEMIGDATGIEIEYATQTDELGYRGDGAGRTFCVWRGGRQIDEQPVGLGHGAVRLDLAAGVDPAIVYLPEGMKPTIMSLRARDGELRPAPALPRWIAYGDSITEGWSASSPARSWVSIVGRECGLDAVNLGYAGAARGEIVVAEQIAALEVDVISVAYGTNCWTTIPHSADMVRSITDAFLRIVRSAHPDVPIVVVSPITRPGAELTPNRLGASQAELRAALEQAVLATPDPLVHLVGGRDLVDPELLRDGIHPDDAGHQLLADTIGRELTHAIARLSL